MVAAGSPAAHDAGVPQAPTPGGGSAAPAGAAEGLPPNEQAHAFLDLAKKFDWSAVEEALKGGPEPGECAARSALVGAPPGGALERPRGRGHVAALQREPARGEPAE